MNLLTKSLVGALAVAAFVLPAASAAPGPVATVGVTECSRGSAAEDRRAEFRGAMRRVKGTRRMWVRFFLEERVGAGSFVRVDAPGLGTWRKSRAGVRRFAYRQKVLQLAEGSSYRVAAQFRWLGAGGRVVRSAARRSRGCRQPGQLPNLRVARIEARTLKGRPDVVRYAVRVANRGPRRSDATALSLTVDGRAVDTVGVPSLGPGEARAVFVNGPECSGKVEARVDPADVVRESSETDNRRAAACPAGS